MADSNINGNLPDFPDSAPLLREEDLSNQKGENGGGGVVGRIPGNIFKLVALFDLNLAGNKMTGKIPS